jgi:hypothetical protein
MHKASRRPSHQSQVCRSHHPCALKKRKRTQGGAQCEGLLRIPIALHTLRGNEGEDSEKSKTRSLSQFYGPVVPVRRVITSRHTIGTQLAFPSINCSQPAWSPSHSDFFVFFVFSMDYPARTPKLWLLPARLAPIHTQISIIFDKSSVRLAVSLNLSIMEFFHQTCPPIDPR